MFGQQAIHRLRTMLLLAVLLVPLSAHGASWFRHANCTSNCNEVDHTCISSSQCAYAWNACPPGTVQTANNTAVDPDDCAPPTECTPGGCDEGWAEVAKQACVDVKKCFSHAGFCYSETCCRQKPQLTCCDALPCTARYKDCDIPQQRVLNDSSRSVIGRTPIAHTGTAIFPFYSSPHVQGGSCEAVRVWGRCFCDDGVSVPGCDPFNSSSWSAAGDDEAALATDKRLPSNMSLLCVGLPPAPPPPGDAAGGAQLLPPMPTPPEAPASMDSNSTGGGTRGHGKQPPPHRTSRGGMVAVIVVACLLLAGGTVGLVSWCCGLLPDVRSLMRLRSGAYEPVFTGQSYTPGLSAPPFAVGGRGGSADIPWNRFCAAVSGVYGRLRYGKRYKIEGESAAAAAERYRRLLSAGNSSNPAHAGSPFRGMGGMGGGPGAAARVSAPRYGGGGSMQRGPEGLVGTSGGDDDDDADEVFTLEERPPRGMVRLPGRPPGLPGSGWHPSTPGAAAAELEMGQVAPPGNGVAAHGIRAGRHNQFDGGGGGGATPEVIHTRQLALSDHSDEDLDAPITMPLSTQQHTGQEHGRRRL